MSSTADAATARRISGLIAAATSVRWTTQTIAPHTYRATPQRPLGEADLPIGRGAQNALICAGYDAAARLTSNGRPQVVITVVDTEARDAAIQAQEERRREALSTALAETSYTQDAPAPVVIERQPVSTADALSALGLCPGSRRRIPGGYVGHDVQCPECHAWVRLIPDAGLAEHPAPADERPEPSRLCGLCGRLEDALAHSYPGGHLYDPLPEVEVGTVELASAWDGYPPLSIAEAEAFLAAGLHPVAEGAGGYSFLIEESGHRLLGRVRCVTEHLGRGVWVRFAAYRPDGSRVGYADNRPAAALLLRDAR